MSEPKYSKIRRKRCQGRYGRCNNIMVYGYIPGIGWKAIEGCDFDVGGRYVNLECSECGWRNRTSIRPKNVADIEEEDEE